MASNALLESVVYFWVVIPKQGIHQGDIFSMFLYCVHNNDLLEELRYIPCAVKIGNLKISGVGFADDISVMSTSL